MEETVSVRLPKKELREFELLLKWGNVKRSEALRDVFFRGIREKKIEIAMRKFQDNEISVSRAAEMSGIPLTLFLDLLAQKGIPLHYTAEDLREDVADLV